MRKGLITIIMMGVITLAVSAPASAGQGSAFSWLNQFQLKGVGAAGPQTHMFQIFNGFMWFRDADGDGIPNGLDPDYTRPLDGTGFGAPEKKTGEEGYYYQHRIRTRYSLSGDSADQDQDRIRLRDRLCDR